MEESFYKEYLRGAILLAPCTKMNILQGTMGYHYYNDMVDQIDLIGLYGLHGHNWEEFRPEVCAHLGRFWCDQERVWNEEPMSARTLSHFFQMGIEGRFQEYADSYIQGKQHRITADIPIENISHTPIAVFYGDADRVCPMDTVEWMMETVGHMVYGNYQFGGYDHSDFGKANDSVFMGELHEALSHLQPHVGPHEEIVHFEEDLSRAIQTEFDHEEREADIDHEMEMQEHMLHHYSEEDPESYEMQRHYRHGVEEEEGASWRDDKYHDHAGFDLRRPHEFEQDHHGIEHESIGHYNDVLEHSVDHERH